MTRRRNHIPPVTAIIATTTWARLLPCTMMVVVVVGVVAFSPSLRHAQSQYYPTATTARGDDEDVSSTPFPFRLSAEAVSSLSDINDDDDATTNTTATPLPLPSDMKLNEIKAELDARNTSFTDCFDRESLQKRLIEARENDDRQVPPKREEEEEEETVEDDDAKEDEPIRVDDATILPIDATNNADYSTTDTTTESTTTTTNDFDRRSTLAQLRSLRVKELKIRLSEKKVRWGTMIEKEELVQALCDALEERFRASKKFSRSGRLVPGKVADVDDESTLLRELGWSESDVERGAIPVRASPSTEQTSSHPPILLDVYATWCGPCKFVAPILEQVAEEVGPTVRVMKLDSDKYPRLSSVLKVSGLPTLIRLDGGEVSKEIQRVEGALSKDQLIDFVNGNFNR